MSNLIESKQAWEKGPLARIDMAWDGGKSFPLARESRAPQLDTRLRGHDAR